MASDEVEAVFDAFDKETGDGRDYDTTVDLAQAYVADNQEKFSHLEDQSLEELVKALEVFRDAGFEEHWKLIQVYLWAEVPPQNIGGSFGISEVQV